MTDTDTDPTYTVTAAARQWTGNVRRIFDPTDALAIFKRKDEQ